jgi:hypothetical protein
MSSDVIGCRYLFTYSHVMSPPVHILSCYVATLYHSPFLCPPLSPSGTVCAPGTYGDEGATSAGADSACDDCPAGSITNTGTGTGATGCTRCPAGRFAPLSTLSVCSACPSGSFTITDASTGAPNTGANACEQCDPGRFSAVSTEDCADCLAGFVTDTGAYPGASKCIPCTGGRFAMAADHQCFSCEPGQSSFEGATVCIPCRDPQWCAGAGNCTEGRRSPMCVTCQQRWYPYHLDNRRVGY